MKSLTVLIALAVFVGVAHAQSADHDAIAETHKLHVSVSAGNGSMNAGGSRHDNSMKWLALDVRFGREFAPDLLGLTLPVGDRLRWSVVYLNEGHPANHHRDGFALQAVYSRALPYRLAAEIGVGPYASMDTTTVDGVQINDARLGALLSVALRVPLNGNTDGLHLRLGYNHVYMPNAPSSNAFLLGLGKTFGTAPGTAPPLDSVSRFWIEAATGYAQTNQTGTDRATSFSVAVKRYRENWGASVTALQEGDDRTRVDRRGIALQGWRVERFNDNWRIAAGIGPYFARNERESSRVRMLALYSLQLERTFARDWKMFLEFSRAQTFQEKNDRDIFVLGIARQFGG